MQINKKKRLDPSFFNTEGPVFMGAKRVPNNCMVGIYGVPFDGTTSFRPGTRFGPAAIREVSVGLETYCPQLDQDLEQLNYADLGSIDIPLGAPDKSLTSIIKSSTLDACQAWFGKIIKLRPTFIFVLRS